MESISKYVGMKIRLYRKIKKLSLDDLSNMICKSKSTLSKYENGQIIIDIKTLLDISNAFGIDIRQLIDFEQQNANLRIDKNRLFNGKPNLYIYHYDGRKNMIIKSFLHLQKNENRDITEANLFFNVSDYDSYEKCEFFYYGHLESFDIVTYLFLENQENCIEKLYFSILNPFGRKSTTMGLLSGISNNPITPVSLKCLVSTHIIDNKNIPIEDLCFTKEDFKVMKQFNMLML